MSQKSLAVQHSKPPEKSYCYSICIAHILEKLLLIFIKPKAAPSPNTIKLLKTRSFKLNEETKSYQSRSHFKTTKGTLKVEVSTASTSQKEKAIFLNCYSMTKPTWDHLSSCFLAHSWKELSQCINATKYMDSNSHKVTMTAKPQLFMRSQKLYDAIFLI